MQNRLPTPGQEGRVLITPENGAPAFYAKVQMADNPLDDGTPLTMETLLKHTTAALYGLSESAVPDEVFAGIKRLIDTVQTSADSKSEIMFGTYIGTGTYGVNNPCQITFPFTPKLFFIGKGDLSTMNLDSTSGFGGTPLAVWGVTNRIYFTRGEQCVVSYEGNTVQWYYIGWEESAIHQNNEAGQVYHYFAMS